MNILKRADEIVNERAEEKQREYGPFDSSMEKAAVIATELCNKTLTAEDMFKCMMALKLSRIAYSAKEDSLLDLVAYAAGFNNYTNNKKCQEKQRQNARPVRQQNKKQLKGLKEPQNVKQPVKQQKPKR